MKKIVGYTLVLFGILGLGISFVANASDYGPCPQDNPNCHSTTTTPVPASAIPYASEADKKAACAASTDAANEYKCKKTYSCESLFVGKAEARACNWKRCVADKGYDATDLADSDNPCNCKYGKNGDGNNVGIPLNTSLPFVGRCVERSSGEAGDDSALNAFPTLVSVATRMLVTVILLVSFIMIVVGGVQWSSGDAKGGKAKITKVIIGIAMLGMMGAILRLINPNFFK